MPWHVQLHNIQDVWQGRSGCGMRAGAASSVGLLQCLCVLGCRAVQVLQGVSAHIGSGQCVGIMGPSGSGKSTLLYLIAGLFRPQRGSITINGVDVRDLDLPALRDALAFVLQQPFLHNATLLESIRCAAWLSVGGRLSLTRSRKMQAAAWQSVCAVCRKVCVRVLLLCVCIQCRAFGTCLLQIRQAHCHR